MQTKTKRKKIKNKLLSLSLPIQLNKVLALIEIILVTKIMQSLYTVWDILNNKSSLNVFCRGANLRSLFFTAEKYMKIKNQRTLSQLFLRVFEDLPYETRQVLLPAL